VAKTRKELLISVKSSIEDFINNPLLNPDFSEIVVDNTDAVVTDYLQDILDDIDYHLELYDEMDDIIEVHEAIERAELEQLTASHANESDIPDEVLDATFEDRSV
jgi:hypothetical protein